MVEPRQIKRDQLTYPLDAEQVESLDRMLDDLFQRPVDPDEFAARNPATSTIPIGRAVFLSSVSDRVLTVQGARANATATMAAVGVTAVPIRSNQTGTVRRSGVLTGIDTSAWTVGAALYVSSDAAGHLTTTVPTHPNIQQQIGIVLTSKAVGSIFLAIEGDHGADVGTIETSWKIGEFGTVAWGATQARTQTLQDVTGTIYCTGGIVVAVADGGTGLQSYTVGDLLYASGTTTLSKLADVAVGNALISGGVGVAPAWGKINLGPSGTIQVTGTLAIGSAPGGGTGLSSWLGAGALLTSTASTTAAVIRTGSIGPLARSQGANDPVAWSTWTTPSSFAANALVYASSSNVLAGLATVNDSVLTTNVSGVPTWALTSTFVKVTGTPVDSQIAVWTGAQNIEGGSNLTWDGITMIVDGKLQIGATAAQSGQIRIKKNSKINARNNAGTSDITMLGTEITPVEHVVFGEAIVPVQVNSTRMGFSGLTSSFPALKRSTTDLEVRLADDSGYTKLVANVLESKIATGTAPLVVASTTAVGNLNADLLDGIEAAEFVQRDGSIPLTANWDAGGFEIRSLTFESDVATGTAPLVVASTTLVSNLNADLLDGDEASVFTRTVGTPLNNDIGIWTDASSLEGDSSLTWTGSQLGITGTLQITGNITSSAGTITGVNVTASAGAITGNAAPFGDLCAGNSTTVGTYVVRTVDAATDYLEFHIRPEAERNAFLSFTENTIADRWIVGIVNADANLYFSTGSPSSNTARMIVNGSGVVGIGTTAFPSGTAGLVFADGTALSSLGTNTAGLYANDVAGTVEMFAIDEGGSATQISPHNFTLFTPDSAEIFPWSYYSENRYLGEEVNVDVARLARAVETLTGQQFVFTRSLPVSERLEWLTTQWVQVLVMQRAYEQWEIMRGAFVPTREQPVFIQEAPPDPVVKRPPAWLLARLQAQGRWDEAGFQRATAELRAWNV